MTTIETMRRPAPARALRIAADRKLDPSDRMRAMMELTAIPGPGGWRILRRALDEPEPVVGLGASLALARLGIASDVARIERAARAAVPATRSRMRVASLILRARVGSLSALPAAPGSSLLPMGPGKHAPLAAR